MVLCKYAAPVKSHLKILAIWLSLSNELIISSVLIGQKKAFIFQLQRNISSDVKNRSLMCRVPMCSGNKCTHWHIPISLLPVVTRALHWPFHTWPWCTGCIPEGANSFTNSTPACAGGITLYPQDHALFQTSSCAPVKSIGTNEPSHTMSVFYTIEMEVYVGVFSLQFIVKTLKC